MVIFELVSGISCGLALLNGGALFLLFRQYRSLAEVSFEFAALVAEAIREQEDGSLVVDPVTLAGTTLDHLNLLQGLNRWFRG